MKWYLLTTETEDISTYINLKIVLLKKSTSKMHWTAVWATQIFCLVWNIPIIKLKVLHPTIGTAALVTIRQLVGASSKHILL